MYNVLLIDDERISVNALKRRVDWGKYKVDIIFIAYSMKQAQEIIEREKIDFMLCDIEMPNGSGLDLLEWVKMYYPSTECIYVTCHPEFDYMRKAMQLGSVDYLLKPIDYEELDEVLTQLVIRLEKKTQHETIPERIVLKIAQKEAALKQHSSVHAAKKYILEHIQENICIEDISKAVHINPQYLMRLFKKEVGMSILEFITEERIILAQELLATTDIPINRVADSVGYGNYSYFTKIFKRKTGLTPKEYREQRNYKER